MFSTELSFILLLMRISYYFVFSLMVYKPSLTKQGTLLSRVQYAQILLSNSLPECRSLLFPGEWPRTPP